MSEKVNVEHDIYKISNNDLWDVTWIYLFYTNGFCLSPSVSYLVPDIKKSLSVGEMFPKHKVKSLKINYIIN